MFRVQFCFVLWDSGLEKQVFSMQSVEVRLQSPQSLKAAATKLQSIGAIFNCVDAVMADNAPASKGSSVANLAASWHKAHNSYRVRVLNPKPSLSSEASPRQVGSGQFLQIEQQLLGLLSRGLLGVTMAMVTGVNRAHVPFVSSGAEVQ